VRPMEILRAPWRMKYIEYVALKKEKGCFICSAAEKGVGEESLVLFKGEYGIVQMNLYPYNTGHLLVSPLRHVSSLSALKDEELLSLIKLVSTSIEAVKKALKPDGFNVGLNLGRVAGAGLEDHIHFHVVPRWNGDTNFMPIIANTKVVPEAIIDTYRRIAKYRDLIREK